MNKALDADFEQNDNKIDWDDLIGESPKSIKVSEFEFLMIIVLIIFGIFVLKASIWGMWADGDQ